MEKIVWLFEQYGYWIVFLGVFVDTVGFPFPAEIALFIAGALSFDDRTDPFIVVLLGTIAAVFGDSVTFLLGRRITESREQRIVELYCRWTRCTLGSDHCHQRARSYIGRFRARALLFAKFVLGARQFVPPIAGMVRMLRFIILDVVGALLWAGTVTALGYWSRGQLESIVSGFGQFQLIFSTAIVSSVSIFLFWKSYKLRRFGPPKIEELIEIGRGDNIGSRALDLKGPISKETKASL